MDNFIPQINYSQNEAICKMKKEYAFFLKNTVKTELKYKDVNCNNKNNLHPLSSLNIFLPEPKIPVLYKKLTQPKVFIEIKGEKKTTTKDGSKESEKISLKKESDKEAEKKSMEDNPLEMDIFDYLCQFEEGENPEDYGKSKAFANLDLCKEKDFPIKDKKEESKLNYSDYFKYKFSHPLMDIVDVNKINYEISKLEKLQAEQIKLKMWYICFNFNLKGVKYGPFSTNLVHCFLHQLNKTKGKNATQLEECQNILVQDINDDIFHSPDHLFDMFQQFSLKVDNTDYPLEDIKVLRKINEAEKYYSGINNKFSKSFPIKDLLINQAYIETSKAKPLDKVKDFEKLFELVKS